MGRYDELAAEAQRNALEFKMLEKKIRPLIAAEVARVAPTFVQEGQEIARVLRKAGIRPVPVELHGFRKAWSLCIVQPRQHDDNGYYWELRTDGAWLDASGKARIEVPPRLVLGDARRWLQGDALATGILIPATLPRLFVRDGKLVVEVSPSGWNTGPETGPGSDIQPVEAVLKRAVAHALKRG